MAAGFSFRRLAAIVAITIVAATIAVPTSVWLVGCVRFRAARSEFTERLGPLEPVSYRLADVPRQRNAAFAFAAAAEELRLAADPGDVLVLARAVVVPEDSWDAGTRAVVERLVADNAAVVDRAVEAAGLEESSYGVEYGLGLAMPTSRVSPLVTCGRLLAGAARLEIAAGRFERAAELLRALGRLAHTLEQEVELGYQVGGWTCESLAQRVVADLAEDSEADGATLAAMAGSLPAGDLERGFSRSLGWETASQIRNMDHPLGGEPGWWDRTRWRISRGVVLASVLDDRVQLLDRLSAPIPEVGLDGQLAVAVARMRAVQAGRLVLARAAAIAATGDVSSSAETADRTALFTGTALAVARQDDGGILVSIPGGEQLLAEVFTAVANPGPRLRLVLPARRRGMTG